MSELPDDLSQWPRDPYVLLGVAHGVSSKELRRAYSKLIRRFKPEQHPEHFRRIRDAYEFIERSVKFAEAQQPPDELPPPTPENADGVFGQRIEDTGGGDIKINPWYPPLSESLENEVDEAWSQAVQGETAAAYIKLRDLYFRHGNKADLAARLYWLLTLQPDLDNQRDACDWLVQGLCDQHLLGPCRELYRRGVDRNPAEALTERYTSLLRQPAAGRTLAEFVQWRWLAAGRLKNWRTIADDIETLGPRMRSDEEEMWAHLLLIAIDQLAWFPDDAAKTLLRDCRQEIEQAAHLHQRLGDNMIRLDVAMEISKSLHKLGDHRIIANELGELVARLWTEPLTRVRPQLLAWLDRMRQDPHRWLKDFDFLQLRAPTLLAQLGRSMDMLLDCLPAPFADGRRPDVLAELVLDFLENTSWRVYKEIRPQVLDFCVRELIAPETIVHLLERVPKYSSGGLTQTLQEDWPLRYVCLGYRMFWVSA